MHLSNVDIDVVVVTGGAGALGSALARQLAAQKYRVAIVESPHGMKRAEALAGELGAHARAYAGDVASPEAWKRLVASIESDLGAPSHAALIAGAWRGGKALHEEPDDGTWSAMMSANLETVYQSMRALVPGMVRNKRGGIVAVGSRAAVLPTTSAGAAAYAASKAAVVALAQATSAEVHASGVRINVVLPSTLDTPANRAAMPNANFADWVTTESAARVVAFLLSDDARDISGAAIPIYGGS